MSETEINAVAEVPDCPKCSGPMWDNREGKRNPKAPDFKCKNRECDGVIWPPRGAVSAAGPAAGGAESAPRGAVQPGMPSCPICGGPMWDDRSSKRNPRAPDFKCRNRPRFKGGEGCEGVIWPPRDGQPSPYPAAAPRAAGSDQGPPPSPSRASAARSAPSSAPPVYDAPPPDDRDFDPNFNDDDLPF